MNVVHVMTHVKLHSANQENHRVNNIATYNVQSITFRHCKLV